MIVAAHQPNFCPWLGYFAKISRSDVFIFMDNVQFSKNTYINRVRIKTAKGSQWLTVPVKTGGRFGQKIGDVQIDEGIDWKAKIIKALKTNYGRARYFRDYFPLLAENIRLANNNLCDLNMGLIGLLSGILNMPARFVRGSVLNCGGKGTDLLISMVSATGGDAYLSGDGAQGYQEEDKFEVAGIKLLKNNFQHPVYEQLWGEFQAGLSILDVLFNVGANATMATLGGK
jgi:hypothetical protein